ncbi:MAG TPA: hypothetical protein VGD66_13485 [Allosphingosinicella sp.]|jgi:hypothetical protein
MPPFSGEDEAAIRQLYTDLSADQPGLHTIQILSIDPDTDDEWRWLLLSCHTDKFREAVELFTKYRRTEGQAEKTLAFDDNTEPLGRYTSWPSKTPAVAESKVDLKFIRQKYGKLTPIVSAESLDSRYKSWCDALAYCFDEGGSTIWLTIRHRLRGAEQPPVSSMFLVFDSEIEIAVRSAVVHRAREFLFDQVLRFYERQVEKQHEVMEKGLRDYLLKDPADMLIAGETMAQIKRMKPLLTGRIPLVIEGERGTGKLNVARLVQEARTCMPTCGYTACAAGDDGDPIVINGMLLSEDQGDACGYLQQKGIITSNGELDDSFCADVIFDDLHLAGRKAQHIVYRMIDQRFGWEAKPDDSRSAPPWILVTVAPNLESAIQRGQLIPELSILGAFRISLPTLHDRLGSASSEQRLQEFRAIVSYLASRARQVVPHSRKVVLSDEDLKAWMAESWQDNYWGLRQRVLQQAIASLA